MNEWIENKLYSFILFDAISIWIQILRILNMKFLIIVIESMLISCPTDFISYCFLSVPKG